MLGAAPSAVNAAYQPIVSSWEIEEGGGPFTVFGAYEITPESTTAALIGRFGSAGGGVITIRFQITDPVYCEACTATGTVLSRPPGMATVPGEYGGTVTIADRLGCFLNESNEALIGRKGYAVYLNSEFEGPCPGMPNPSFEIISLCCAETQCAS
jgi:hypothetical protein